MPWRKRQLLCWAGPVLLLEIFWPAVASYEVNVSTHFQSFPPSCTGSVMQEPCLCMRSQIRQQQLARRERDTGPLRAGILVEHGPIRFSSLMTWVSTGCSVEVKETFAQEHAAMSTSYTVNRKAKSWIL